MTVISAAFLAEKVRSAPKCESMARPCSRAVCQHCGLRVGLFGVNGFGFSRRRQCLLRLKPKPCEARCAAAAAQEMPLPIQPIEPGVCEAAKLLVSKVDVGMDVEILHENDLVCFLYNTKSGQSRFLVVSPEMEGAAGGRPRHSARGHFGEP